MIYKKVNIVKNKFYQIKRETKRNTLKKIQNQM